MATESVATPNGFKAFEGYDSSVYAAWLEAVTDLMMSEHMSQTALSTPRNLVGLMYALTQAVQERLAEERREPN